VESELDTLITRRDTERRRTEGEREQEELYMQSVRAHNEKRQRQRLWDLLRYHERMIRVHTTTSEVIVGRHRLEVERCEALLGLNGKETA
jgi:hypothetical protein